MITIWHNQEFSLLKNERVKGENFPASVAFSKLTPIITLDTDNLEEAFLLSQNNLDYRKTSVGDLLQKSDDTCWFVDFFGFAPLLNQKLPHVGNTINPEYGDPFEIFPTLDLNFEDSKLIASTRLDDYWRYIETRQWKDGSIRELLRYYK